MTIRASFSHDFAQVIQSGIPTSYSEIRANKRALLSIAPVSGFPVNKGYVDPGEAYKYSRSILKDVSINYFGGNIPSEAIDHVAAAGRGTGVNLQNPTANMLNTVLTDVTGADLTENVVEIFQDAGLRQLPGNVVGGAGQIATISARSLKDGKVSAQEARAMIGTAASFAGTSIGAAIGGVAGPIGAVAGAVVGTVIGQLIPDPSPPPSVPPRFRTLTETRQSMQEAFEALNDQRLSVVDTCEATEKDYWKAFDEFFHKYATTWANLERELGFRFDLRWFDDAYGSAFYQSRPSEMDAIERVSARFAPKLGYRAESVASERYANYQTFLDDKGSIATRCRIPLAGCPYPIKGATLPFPASGLPGNRSPIYSPGAREAWAFASRGLVWVPPNMRLDCGRYIPYPSSVYWNPGHPDAASQKQYERTLETVSNNLQIKVAHFRKEKALLEADLSRTAAVMNSYANIMARRIQYISQGVKMKELEEQVGGYIESRANWLNNTALIGGIGVLGLSIWGAARR